MRKMNVHLSDVEVQEIMEELDLIHTSSTSDSSGDSTPADVIQVNISAVSQSVGTRPCLSAPFLTELVLFYASL